MPKMSIADVKAMLASETANALAAMSAARLAEERADAMDYYLGDMRKDMPAQEGRSRAVSLDVADTIEGLMPQLMDVFAGADEVVRFEPVGPEDVAAAQQETDYVNHVFMQQNPGFMILYGFLKDALLSCRDCSARSGSVSRSCSANDNANRCRCQGIPACFCLMVPFMYIIRAVDGGDDELAESLGDLHQRTFFDSAAVPGFERGSWWLVYHGTEAVAFAGLVPSTHERNSGYFCRVGVLQTRGRGLQRRLMRAVETEARRNGWDSVVSDTTGNLFSANNFIAAGYRLYDPQSPWGWANTLYWRKSLSRA